MTTERHFITNNENVQLPIENMHQSLHSSHNAMQTEHLSHRNQYEQSGNMDEDRKVIIGEPGRQYILTNEAPVIVSSKVRSQISKNLRQSMYWEISYKLFLTFVLGCNGHE